MKAMSKALAIIIGFILLAGLGSGGYFALQFTLKLFEGMHLQVAVVTAIGSGIVLLAAMIIARRIHQATMQDKASQLRGEKVVTYQLCIDVWADVLRHGGMSEACRSTALVEQLQALDRSLMLYGSSDVVRSHTALRALERENGPQDADVRRQFAMTLLEIRQDLGTEIGNLTAAQLLELLLVDADNASASAKANAYQDLQPRVSLASNS